MTAFEENGCVELKPHAHKNNALRICECSACYLQETNYTLKRHSTLYTRMGPVRCSLFNLAYHNGSCKLKFEGVAKEERICFSSKVTCASDEIGGGFVQDVVTIRTSFKAY